MTNSTSYHPVSDTLTAQAAATVRARLVESELPSRSASTPVLMQGRSVPSSRIEGQAVLRYSPREPSIRETSTAV